MRRTPNKSVAKGNSFITNLVAFSALVESKTHSEVSPAGSALAAEQLGVSALFLSKGRRNVPKSIQIL